MADQTAVSLPDWCWLQPGTVQALSAQQVTSAARSSRPALPAQLCSTLSPVCLCVSVDVVVSVSISLSLLLGNTAILQRKMRDLEQLERNLMRA
jgi:hypothetical protein